MVEFGIKNIHTQEENIIFGYSVADAYRRAGLNMGEWHTTYCEYID